MNCKEFDVQIAALGYYGIMSFVWFSNSEVNSAFVDSFYNILKAKSIK